MANELFPIELKAVGDQGEIEGYASNFGNRDLAGDIVQRGAFTRSLKGRPAGAVAMLWGHDQKRPIGVWSEIAEDHLGLRVKGRILTQTRDGADAWTFPRLNSSDSRVGRPTSRRSSPPNTSM